MKVFYGMGLQLSSLTRVWFGTTFCQTVDKFNNKINCTSTSKFCVLFIGCLGTPLRSVFSEIRMIPHIFCGVRVDTYYDYDSIF